MHRRKFLLSASMFVVALKLLPSTPALAHGEPLAIVPDHPAYPGVPYDELVYLEESFRILEDLKLGTLAQARNFLVEDLTLESTGDLRSAVHTLAIDHKSPQIWERAKIIQIFHRELKKTLGPSIDEHLFWLASKPRSASVKLREYLETGRITDVRFLAPCMALWFS